MNEIVYNTLVINQDYKQCFIDGEDINLTKKEYQLLNYLLEKPNYVHSREMLVFALWDRNVSLKTVDITVSRLRKKLGKYRNNLYSKNGFGYGFKT